MSFITTRRATSGLAALALGFTLAACGSDEESGPVAVEEVSEGCTRPVDKTEVTVGVGASLAYAHIYVAEEMGYFDDENLDINFTTIAKPSDTLPLLNAGDIDGAFGGLSAGFLNAIDRDLDIRLVQARGEYPADQEKAAGFMVRKDLLDSGKVKKIADLKGKTIGLAGGESDIGNSGGFFISQILGTEGLTLKDVKWANVSQADAQAAFDSKAIDAAFMPSPFTTLNKDAGTADFFGDQEVMAGATSGGLMMGPSLLEDNRVVGESFLRALLRAADVMRDGDYRENADVVAVLEKYKFEPEVVERTPLYSYEEGLPLNPETFDVFQQTFLDHGGILTIEERMDFDDIVDTKMHQASIDSYIACGYES